MAFESNNKTETNKQESKTILIAAGGTSGHIYPALAIATELRSLKPSCHIVFSGIIDSLEHEMAIEEGFDFEPITAQNLPSRYDRRYLSWFFRNFRGMRLSYKTVKSLKPDLVLGTGGYVSAPVIAVSKMMRIPYVLHEQNSVPGRANRFFSKSAETVFISYDISRTHFSRKTNLVLTGNPVRHEFYLLEKSTSRELLGIDKKSFVVLVMGGSLGAKRVNDAVKGLLRNDQWITFVDQHPNLVLFVSTGTQNDERVADMLSAIPHVSAEPFYHDAPARIATCDFYVGRAGAMTCAEISALGKPSLLIPYPHAADDHQTENANVMKLAGAAFVCDDDSFNSHVLLECIRSAVNESELIKTMGENAKALATPQASRTIAEHIINKLYSYEHQSR